jgi:hypothetical protein
MRKRRGRSMGLVGPSWNSGFHFKSFWKLLESTEQMLLLFKITTVTAGRGTGCGNNSPVNECSALVPVTDYGWLWKESFRRDPLPTLAEIETIKQRAMKDYARRQTVLGRRQFKLFSLPLSS